jgi:tRNA threonylcarbamoyladenosine biosynthesis protein TsaB
VSTLLTLALDAAAGTGTVAVVRGRDILAACEVPMRGEQEERLMPAVAEALAGAGVGVGAIERIVCGSGPGSFTGLRIAAAIAKGLAMARHVPLYEVSSLLLIVAGSPAAVGPGRYLAVLDALRGEVFAAGYEVQQNGEVADLTPPALLPRDALHSLAARLGARTIGPAEALQAVPHARGVARLEQRVDRMGPVSLDAWEPAYGRLAEAQVRWEREHGRSLPVRQREKIDEEGREGQEGRAVMEDPSGARGVLGEGRAPGHAPDERAEAGERDRDG